MVKMSLEEANRFLDKKYVEQFLNKNSVKIFGHQESAEVAKIDRSNTLNPTSYNILYSIKIGSQYRDIRAATSTIWDYDYNFNTLKLLYENGFGKGDVLVAKPLAYFSEFNLMCYENVEGDQLKSKLNEDITYLKDKVKLVACALKKIHQHKKISYHLWDHDWNFNTTQISRYDQKLADQVINIRTKILAELARNTDKCLCHGDFQPDNILAKGQFLYIIDWGSTTLAQKEMDLASFVIKLNIMLPEFGNAEYFEPLRECFLTSYGLYDQRMFRLFSTLYSIRILNSFAEFPEYENAKKRIPLAIKVFNDNFSQLEYET